MYDKIIALESLICEKYTNFNYSHFESFVNSEGGIKMKRITALALTTLLVTVMCASAGCGSSEGEKKETAGTENAGTENEAEDTSAQAGETEKTEKKNITLTFGSHQSGLPSSGIVQQIAEEYEEKTGVRIDFQITPDAQWKDVLKTKISAGEAPDIFCIDSDPVALEDQWKPTANCVPLTGEEWIARMDASVIPAVSVGDDIYGISFPGYKVYWYYYNKEIFENLGLTAPTNYEEFKNVCQTIKDAGIIPVYEAIQDGWHQQLPFYELGGYYSQIHEGLYDKLNNNEMKLTDIPEALTVLQQLKEFQQSGFFGDDYMSNSTSGDYKAIADGTYAMTLEGFGWEQSLIEQYPEMEGKIGIFTMPWADAQCIGIAPAGNAYFISSTSDYAEEAKEFFRYLATPEVLQQRLEGDPECIALCWPEIAPQYPQSYVDYLDSISSGTVMQVAVKYTGANWMDTGKDIAAMYADAMTPEEVLQSISDRRDEQALLMGDENWK